MFVNCHEWPNQSPEPTGIGAVSSAVAVHDSPPPWLSLDSLGFIRAPIRCIARKGQSDFTFSVGYVAEAFVEFTL